MLKTPGTKQNQIRIRFKPVPVLSEAFLVSGSSLKLISQILHILDSSQNAYLTLQKPTTNISKFKFPDW